EANKSKMVGVPKYELKFCFSADSRLQILQVVVIHFDRFKRRHFREWRLLLDEQSSNLCLLSSSEDSARVDHTLAEFRPHRRSGVLALQRCARCESLPEILDVQQTIALGIFLQVSGGVLARYRRPTTIQFKLDQARIR